MNTKHRNIFDYLDSFVNLGVDLIHRRIFLSSKDSLDDNADRIVRAFYIMESLSPSEKIELIVSCFGGDVYDMFAIYDIVKTTPCPVHTIAMGKCMSAMPLIVAAGTKGQRWAMPNTYFMIHDTLCDYDQSMKSSAILSDSKHIKSYTQRLAKLMEKNSNMKYRYWMDLLSKPNDVYFDTNEAIKLGIIDNVFAEKENNE